ncbi:endonuclease [Sporosarcina sp. 179-K 3D1 HS]|uniref:endonuclease I family protein n=1 Tax=Sporosarcina sp. 179-K 3D1 HS TaxID=3232169 RepID=UPI0039A2B793
MEKDKRLLRQLEELESMEQHDADVLVAGLAENQNKIKMDAQLYYDERKDRAWIKDYYRDILFAYKSPIQLGRDLQELIRTTHRTVYPYYVSKDQYLYTWVDLQPDGQLKSIYSGIPKNPKQVIEEEFETIQKRFERYRELLLNPKVTSQEFDQEILSIASQHKFNAEHIVPQSWFRAKEPMKGDLHHLFACEPKCNRIRANFPYYEFNAIADSTRFRNDCGIYDTNRFEPEYGKGTAARALLYFILRYPEEIDDSYRGEINIPLMIQWHELFPADDYEKHRNQAIYEIQGNRNPFIDFPDLVNKIAF